MAKQGMARPEWTHTQPRNDAPSVPELQGKAKRTKVANPVATNTASPAQKIFHQEDINSTKKHS